MADNNVESRVAVVEQRVDGLEKWRAEHCADNERQIEALTRLPAEIAVLATKVALLVETQANLWRLLKWLVLALIAMAAAAWGVKEIVPLLTKGGL